MNAPAISCRALWQGLAFLSRLTVAVRYSVDFLNVVFAPEVGLESISPPGLQGHLILAELSQSLMHSNH